RYLRMVLFLRAPRATLLPYTTLFRSRKVVGRKVMGGQSTYIPLRLNAAGVIPIIFAVAILILPQTFIGAFPQIGWLQGLGAWFRAEEHTSVLQSPENLVCRPLLEKQY